MNGTDDFSLISLLTTLSRWKKKIFLWVMTAGIFASVVALMLPEYYQASTTFYAASPELANPAPLGSITKEPYIYGTDDDLDRLFSIANSTEMYKFLIKEFDLYKHYDIDSTSKNAAFKVQKQLSKLFKTTKTKYGAIELTVEDKDRALSAKMANAARDFIDDKAQTVIKSSQGFLVQTYENNIKSKEQQASLLSDTLNRIKTRFNIIDTRSQGEVLAELITQGRGELEESKSKAMLFEKSGAKRDSVIKYSIKAQSAETKVAKLNEDLKMYNEGISATRKVELEYARLIDQLSLDKERLKQIRASYEGEVPALHITEYAFEPTIRSWPNRWLIVSASMILALIFSLVGIVFVEGSRTINWKDIWNA